MAKPRALAMQVIDGTATKGLADLLVGEPAPRDEEVLGPLPFKPVLAMIGLIQGFQFFHESIGHVIRVTVHGRNLPVDSWWIIPDYRALVWLLAAPLLALIVLRLRWSLRTTLIVHLSLFGLLTLITGLLVFPLEEMRFEETTLLRFGGEGLAQTKALFATLDTDPSGVKFHFWFWCSETGDGIVTYALMSAVGYLVLHINLRSKRRQQSESLQRQLDHLRHQALCNRLQPHFLFNTLNMIGSLAAKNPDTARACIHKLGALLRHSLESLPEPEVDLEQEFEILECYLQIQKMRYGDKFDFRVEIDEGVTDARMPAFVLQPLVENCFLHGFRDKKDVGYVGVFATRQADACRLEVVDNGATFDPHQTLDENLGIGLTRERLRLQYHDRASVHFEPVQPCGLRAVVTLPYHNGGLR